MQMFISYELKAKSSTQRSVTTDTMTVIADPLWLFSSLWETMLELTRESNPKVNQKLIFYIFCSIDLD